jgi:sulfatase maturation enzyme AslB (radical SAM superfamily)
MRPTCNLRSLEQVVRFADEYELLIRVDLIHYSLPYFSEGPERVLQFQSGDRPMIERVVAELIRLKHARPQMLTDSLAHLRSIPDWLSKGPQMKVPCDAYRMIWVGPDGTVQMCYVTFKLGNLHEQKLRDMMFTPAHLEAARSAYALDCPNCHCEAGTRIKKDWRSIRTYATPQPFEI